MNKERIHIYCIPGLGANPSIFEFIQLPDNYYLHYIQWIIPNKEDSIEDYAKKMCSSIEHSQIILLGVSFGGIIVQEMSKHIKVQKVVIISSIKTKYELPKRLRLARDSKLYKLLPTSLPRKIHNWQGLALGESYKKIAKAYQKYLNVLDKNYLDWAIKNVLYWQQEVPLDNVIHLHGSRDKVFPIENIKNYIEIPNATHAAILRRSKWLNEHLPNILK